jgi:hypothetical protein
MDDIRVEVEFGRTAVGLDVQLPRRIEVPLRDGDILGIVIALRPNEQVARDPILGGGAPPTGDQASQQPAGGTVLEIQEVVEAGGAEAGCNAEQRFSRGHPHDLVHPRVVRQQGRVPSSGEDSQPDLRVPLPDNPEERGRE